MTCRKRIDDVETGGKSLTRDKSGGCPDFGPDGIRHEGGVTLNWAVAWNVGTCRPDAKGEVQMGGPHEDKSTEAGHRDGTARSSGEGPVMGVERRSRADQGQPAANASGEEPGVRPEPKVKSFDYANLPAVEDATGSPDS